MSKMTQSVPLVIGGPNEEQLSTAKKGLVRGDRVELDFSVVSGIDKPAVKTVVTAFDLKQDPNTGKWTIRGTIEDPRRARVGVVLEYDAEECHGSLMCV